MTKEEIISYLKNNEMDIARANAALAICDLVFEAYVESDIVNKVLYSPIFCNFSGKGTGTFHQINAKKVISDIAKRVYFDYLERPKSLDEKIARHVELEKQLDNLWQKYIKIINRYDKDEFIKICDEFIKVSREWWYYGAIWEDKGAVISEVIVPKFAKRHDMDISAANEVFNTLSHPEEKMLLNIEREKFLEICLDVANGKKADSKIKKYIADYFWIKSDFYKVVKISPESLLEDAQKEISDKKLEGILSELESMKESHKKLHESKKKLLQKIKLLSEDKKDIKFAEDVILWIDRRKLIMMKDFYHFLEIIGDVSEKNAMDYHEVSLYTIDEFKNLIRAGRKVDELEIKSRENGVLLKYEKGMPLEIFYGKDALDIFQAAISFKHDGDIKGQVASKGGVKKISGKVRIVHHPTKEIFNEGEILVTSMTRVEFVPLMRKAKAIITDEGGIACHAAIVSRELGLPCIIGTKIASKALKNGDLVEMDTERGIVKIIK